MSLFKSLQLFAPLILPKNLTNFIPALKQTDSLAGGCWSLMTTRNVIRDKFPRAKEYKRITVHGFWKRMRTASGRKILMRRILKGRHVLAH
uniref:Large ribosomal subunit protein bL34m n=1 Tax=Corethrella appendiculata TaxID=1370023 RepID=U5ETT9_9DIPT